MSKYFIPPDSTTNFPGIRYSDIYNAEWGGEACSPPLPPPTPPTPMELLREWIGKQRFIPQDLSDRFLEQFLIGAKYSIHEASEKLQKYFFAHQECSVLYSGRDPLSKENMLMNELWYVLPLPGITSKGYKVIVAGLVDEKKNIYEPEKVLKQLALVLDLLLWNYELGGGGIVIVLKDRPTKRAYPGIPKEDKWFRNSRFIDCPVVCNEMLLQPNKYQDFIKSDSLNELYTNCLLSEHFKKQYQHCQDIDVIPVRDWAVVSDTLMNCMPCELKELYILNPSQEGSAVKNLHNGIRFTLVYSLDEMKKILPEDMLPIEFGGNLGHVSDLVEQLHLKVLEYRDFFLDFEKKMANDYRRRLCHDKELSKGRGWVYNMELYNPVSEYKTNYYEMMSKKKKHIHPGFGKLRQFGPIHPRKFIDRTESCKREARRQEAEAEFWKPCPKPSKRALYFYCQPVCYQFRKDF